jgi:hypothetical protein
MVFAAEVEVSPNALLAAVTVRLFTGFAEPV